MFMFKENTTNSIIASITLNSEGLGKIRHVKVAMNERSKGIVETTKGCV